MSSTSIAPVIAMPSPHRAAGGLRLWGGELGTVEVAAGPWRLTRRGRIALLAVAAAVVALLAVVGVPAVATTSATTASQGATAAVQPGLAVVPATAETIVVLPGDTLWAIATREMPHLDPREAVVALRAANGVNGGELVAGQRLMLPME